MLYADCYLTRHTSALNKISGRLTEGREFIASFDTSRSVSENAQSAYMNRWYGNASERNCIELTRHFNQRFIISPENFESLRSYVQEVSGDDFPWINHLYMLLNDPYYRWATSEYLSERYQTGLLEIPRADFDQQLGKQLPESVGAGSLTRYAQNVLTAIRDNGLLQGTKKKSIVSPSISVKTMGFMLYSLSDLGSGCNEFDQSPLFSSMLKMRDLLVPLFNEGDQLAYWEFTGDREKIKLNLNHPNLKSWLKACVL